MPVPSFVMRTSTSPNRDQPRVPVGFGFVIRFNASTGSLMGRLLP